MEKITSRKNVYVSHIRALARDADYRYASGEFLCDGVKLLQEALSFSAEITSILWRDAPGKPFPLPDDIRQYYAPEELFSYSSPMANSPGPVFTVRIPREKPVSFLKNALVLENVQDPGNVGTVIRTANAFGVNAVILSGACADLYNPKTVRSTMGAIFRQNIIRTDLTGLSDILKKSALPLYGAVLSAHAVNILKKDVSHSAVAVGSEGNGLSRELIDLCDGEIIIPMEPDSESLNAAVAASVIMWEMRGR